MVRDAVDEFGRVDIVINWGSGNRSVTITLDSSATYQGSRLTYSNTFTFNRTGP